MPRNQRRRPIQSRSQDTVDALIEATARVLREDGWARLSTNKVARVAGVSVGTLYQYFGNKEELVEALVHRIAEERIAAFGSQLLAMAETGDLPLEEGLRVLIRATIEAMRVRVELARRLLLEAPRGGRLDLERAWVVRVTEFVRTALYLRRDAVRDGNPELMAHVVVTACFAVLQDAQAHRPEWVVGDALVDELAALAARYLEPRPPAGSGAPVTRP
jgi:AcrR family transcriptional regulator